MKILILVGTSSNEHHPLMDQVQKETWDVACMLLIRIGISFSLVGLFTRK
jgi:hypothetical protein